MKTKILIAASLAALVVPAASFGRPDGAGSPERRPRVPCSRASLGEDVFRQTYGTVQSNRRNAMGRCVSQWTHAAHQNRVSARAACSAEQADPNFAANHDNKSFAEFYGTGSKHRNAFGKCVLLEGQGCSGPAEEQHAECGQSCKAERSSMAARPSAPSTARTRHDRNAFGKCVSQLSKSTT